MSQLNVTSDIVPPGALGYDYGIADQVGVAATNTYLSLFNPVGSVKTVGWFAATIHRYAIGATSTPNSMIIYRTTAASGGTLVAAANVIKFDNTQPNSVVQVRFGSPTVTLLNSTAVFLASPPMSTGAGNVVVAETTTPGGIIALSRPGEGLAFQTAAGDADQMWGFQVSWCEF